MLRLGMVVDALAQHLAEGAVLLYPVASRSLLSDQDLTSKERMVLGRWADDGLIERWNALPEWPQMLLRALIFRLAVHALHPRSTAAAFPGLARTAALVRLVL